MRIGLHHLDLFAYIGLFSPAIGNVDPALHAHVFPRRATEPDATRTAQPWALDWDAAPRYSESLHGDLQRRLAADLKNR